MSAAFRKLAEAQSQWHHCRMLLASYDAVIDDLVEWNEAEWVFIRQRLEWMRADVQEALEDARRALDELPPAPSQGEAE